MPASVTIRSWRSFSRAHPRQIYKVAFPAYMRYKYVINRRIALSKILLTCNQPKLDIKRRWWWWCFHFLLYCTLVRTQRANSTLYKAKDRQDTVKKASVKSHPSSWSTSSQVLYGSRRYSKGIWTCIIIYYYIRSPVTTGGRVLFYSASRCDYVCEFVKGKGKGSGLI